MNNSQVTAVPKAEKLKATGGRILANLQKVGKSLVFPIAVLPAAAILNRLGGLIAGYGSIDGSGLEQFSYWIGKMIETPGAVVFNNLAAVFAIGVAFGFAKDKRGEAALIGFISYLALNTLVSVENTSLANLIYQKVDTTAVNMYDSNGNFEGTKEFSNILYLIIEVPGGVGPGIDANVTWTTNLGVFGGIVAGLFTAFFYNRFSDIRLPKALGFFSGRRFVPMISLIAMVPVALAFSIIWPWIQFGLTEMGRGMQSMPEVGAGVYAFANRLLIPFGLHQVLNTFFWFQMPVEGMSQVLDGMSATEFAETGAIVINGIQGQGATYLQFGDITAHAQGIEGSGAFQTGFFPIMMFGLPAMGMAMAKNADPQHRKAVWAFMLSAGAVSFITGITEPLEFAFAFTSPLLYALYSLISGFVAAGTVASGAMSGFGFSAGLIDLVISMPIAAQVSTGVSTFGNGYGHMAWILGIGIVSMPVYYFLADITIRKADLATPGRNGNIAGLTSDDDDDDDENLEKGEVSPKWTRMAEKTIDLVGKDNLVNIDNCITRVRLTVKDNSHIQRGMEAEIGYTGYVSTGKTQAHFIIGAESEIVANEMRRLLKEGYGEVSKETEKSEIEKVENNTYETETSTEDDSKIETTEEVVYEFETVEGNPYSESYEFETAEGNPYEIVEDEEDTYEFETDEGNPYEIVEDEEDTYEFETSKNDNSKTEKKSQSSKRNNIYPRRSQLRKRTVKELKRDAKRLGTKGYSTMKKDDLIELVFKAYRK